MAFDPRHKAVVVTEFCREQLRFFSQQDGKLLCSFGSYGTENGQFSRLKGICIQQGSNNVIATDCNRLQVFSTSSDVSSPGLAHLFSVGMVDKQGSEPSQFNDPRGVCCTARGDIIVADCNNYRMQILDCKGRHVRSFGNEGRGKYQFLNPFDVCVEEDVGRMIVTDFINHRLSVWSLDGSQPELIAPVKGYPQGICKHPRAHYIVISCFPSDIQVFDTKTKNQWNVIQRFGSKGSQLGQFEDAHGMCIDDRGVLVVADYSNNRVQMF